MTQPCDDLPLHGLPEDEQEEDRLVEDRLGQRRYTLNAIADAVITQFVEETFGRQDILGELDTSQAQREALTEVTDYVLARDYITLPPPDKEWLLDKIQRDVFRFGPLADFLIDEAVTEISISRYDDIFVRRGFGELARIKAVFRHPSDLAQLLERVLAPVGIQLEDDPFIEAGLWLEGRSVRLSLVGPPMVDSYNGQIRLHPSTPYRLDDLAAIVPAPVAEWLVAILAGGHGLMIAGEVGVTKTTLLGTLLDAVQPADLCLIERAREIDSRLLPETARRSPLLEEAARPFQERLATALDDAPQYLAIDEIRGDEGAAFWSLLAADDGPPLVATFRGKAHPARLHSAFTMGIRKAQPRLDQAEINAALLERFPFVVGLAGGDKGQPPQVAFIGQWAQDEAMEGLTLAPLLAPDENGVWSPTGLEPARDLSF